MKRKRKEGIIQVANLAVSILPIDGSSNISLSIISYRFLHE
jgi:hypothetical protein